MTIEINSNNRVTLGAGENLVLELQLVSGSVVDDLAGRSFALTVFDAAREVIGGATGSIESDEEGSYVAFGVPGTTTDGWYGQAGLRYEIAEILANGRDIIVTAALVVRASAETVSGSAGVVDGPAARFTATDLQGNRRIVVSQRGAPGVPNSLSIGTVTSSAPGGAGAATITGNAPAQTLNLTLPRGPIGPANVLSIGTVTTGPEGGSASATISGSAPAQTLNLTLPRGDVTPEATAAATAASTSATAAATSAAAAAAAVNSAFLASPYVNALRLGRESSSGNADVVATSTFFEQPIAEIGPTERWRGVVRSNGLHFHVPYDATTVLIHNPDTGKMWRTNFGLNLSGTQKWNRAVVGRDGRIYCMPFSATTILVIDPFTMTATLETFGLPSSVLSGTGKWDGGALGSNGLIYCAPYNSANLLIIDPANQSARAVTATQLGLTPSTALGASAKYSGAVAVGGKIYCIPFVLGNALVIDEATTTATQPTYGLTLSDSSKWSGGAVSGTSIYCAPFAATDILVIDTVAGTAVRTAMGATLTGSNKFRGLARVGNRLYGIPHGATSFLVIDPTDTTASAQGTATRNNFNAYDVRVPTTTGDFNSSVKWAGGLAYKGIVYGCPSGSVTAGQDILILDPAANGGAGQAYHTDGRALTTQNLATKWFGGVQHPNGYAYCIPATATDFLIIKDDNPNDDNPVAFRSTMGLTLNTENQKFQGGALLGDNCIYAMPRSGETNMLKIDPSNTSASPYGTATLFGANTAVDLDAGTTGNSLAVLAAPYVLGGVDSQAYHSCVEGMDGKLYGIPYRSEKVLIFNHRGTPGSLTNPQLAITNFGLNLSGADKWVGGCLHPNGKIYCGVRARDTCLVIDTNPRSPTYGQAWLTNFGVNLQTGSGLTGDANLAMKWSYPKVGADGRIYIAPRKAANFLVIDPADTSLDPHGRATFETFGLNLSSFAAIDGYSIANKMAPDGKLYVAALEGLGPAGTGPFLVVDTIARTASWQTFGLPTSGVNSINTGNKVAGAIHTLAGAIIFVPRSGQTAIRIRPRCTPLPTAAVFSPMMIAN